MPVYSGMACLGPLIHGVSQTLVKLLYSQSWVPLEVELGRGTSILTPLLALGTGLKVPSSSLVIGQMSFSPCQVASSLSKPATRRPQNRECQQDRSHFFYNLISEVTPHHLCHIPFIRSESLGPVTFRER